MEKIKAATAIVLAVVGSPALATSDLRWNRLIVQANQDKENQDFASAQRLYIQAIQTLPRDDDARKTVTVRMFADACFENHRWFDARRLYNMNLQLERPLGEDYPGIVYDLMALSFIELHYGRLGSAEALLKRALPIARHHDMTSERAQIFCQLGQICVAGKRQSDLATVVSELAEMERTLKTTQSAIDLADCLVQHKDIAQATRLYEAAAKCKLTVFGDLDRASSFAVALSVLARIYLEQGQPELAEAKLRLALQLDKRPGLKRTVAADINSWLAVALVEQHRDTEVLPYLRAAIDARADAGASAAANQAYAQRDQKLLKLIQSKTPVPQSLLKPEL